MVDVTIIVDSNFERLSVCPTASSHESYMNQTKERNCTYAFATESVRTSNEASDEYLFQKFFKFVSKTCDNQTQTQDNYEITSVQ